MIFHLNLLLISNNNCLLFAVPQVTYTRTIFIFYKVFFTADFIHSRYSRDPEMIGSAIISGTE